MSAHLHDVILYIIAMQIISLQSTTRMYQNIFRSSLHFFNKSEIIQITSIYNFKKVTVMIRHIAGLQISSPLESRRLDMLFMLELGTGFD